MNILQVTLYIPAPEWSAMTDEEKDRYKREIDKTIATNFKNVEAEVRSIFLVSDFTKEPRIQYDLLKF